MSPTNHGRLLRAIEDVDMLMAEVNQCQPMHPKKRGTLLGRLEILMTTLETIRFNEPIQEQEKKWPLVSRLLNKFST